MQVRVPRITAELHLFFRKSSLWNTPLNYGFKFTLESNFLPCRAMFGIIRGTCLLYTNLFTFHGGKCSWKYKNRWFLFGYCFLLEMRQFFTVVINSFIFVATSYVYRFSTVDSDKQLTYYFRKYKIRLLTSRVNVSVKLPQVSSAATW